MGINKMFETNSSMVEMESLIASKRRDVMSRRFEASMAAYISPIERWADHNYAPYDLDYLYTKKTNSSEVVAPLHGFEAQDVYVDISHGYLIILLSDTDLPHAARQEYYCEVLLPHGINPREGYIDIGPNFLTVHLNHKQSVFKRAVSAACRFKLAWQGS